MVRSQTAGFTMVEILIVVVILGILAMVVIPRYGTATTEAREAALTGDLQSLQRQIDRYKVEHTGRGPELGSSGVVDSANFALRLTKQTDIAGTLDVKGRYGPYVPEMPDNPFVADFKLARLVKVGKGVAPRDETTGWFFDTVSQKISPNSKTGALADFPAKPAGRR
ncbi:MAG: type II secretion system protein [Planctomycetota bacterium]